MVMTDARFQRIDEEYQSLRNTQSKILDSLDQTLPRILMLIEQNREAIEQNREAIEQNREAIERNREAIEQNREAIEQNREAIEQNRLAIAEVNSKLDALIAHWQVDYRPPMGFSPD